MEAAVGGEIRKPISSEQELGHDKRRDCLSIVESGRERLKGHRREVAGRVWIPEMWGQEGFLKDWIDSTVFDATVRNAGVTSARAALMEEGRRVAAAGFRIHNSS